MTVLLGLNILFAAIFLYLLCTKDYTNQKFMWYLDGFAFLINAVIVLNHFVTTGLW